MELLQCPSRLTLIRHGESESNALNKRKKQDLVYKRFLAAYDRDWQSLETRTLAFAVKQKFFPGSGQHDALLTEDGKQQARETGIRLKEELSLPDAVFLSGAPRTLETFDCIKKGWPELKNVSEVYPYEERLREQEHGLITVYSDLRAMFAIHPEQRVLHDADGEHFYKFPNGENASDVKLRLGLWLQDIRMQFAGKHVLTVTHFRTILCLRMVLEDFDPKEFNRINDEDGPVNCGVTTYRKDPTSGELVLEFYNKKLYD